MLENFKHLKAENIEHREHIQQTLCNNKLISSNEMMDKQRTQTFTQKT